MNFGIDFLYVWTGVDLDKIALKTTAMQKLDILASEFSRNRALGHGIGLANIYPNAVLVGDAIKHNTNDVSEIDLFILNLSIIFWMECKYDNR